MDLVPREYKTIAHLSSLNHHFWYIFSNNFHVDILDRFRKTVVDKVKFDIAFLEKHSKEENMKIKYANKFIQDLKLGDLTTCLY